MKSKSDMAFRNSNLKSIKELEFYIKTLDPDWEDGFYCKECGSSLLIKVSEYSVRAFCEQCKTLTSYYIK